MKVMQDRTKRCHILRESKMRWLARRDGHRLQRLHEIRGSKRYGISQAGCPQLRGTAGVAPEVKPVLRQQCPTRFRW